MTWPRAAMQSMQQPCQRLVATPCGPTRRWWQLRKPSSPVMRESMTDAGGNHKCVIARKHWTWSAKVYTCLMTSRSNPARRITSTGVYRLPTWAWLIYTYICNLNFLCFNWPIIFMRIEFYIHHQHNFISIIDSITFLSSKKKVLFKFGQSIQAYVYQQWYHCNWKFKRGM